MDCLDRPPRTTLTKMNADAIIDYYAASDEAPRLTANPHGRLELARTRELLARLLPAPPASVLDVGGATGVYAGWLAGLGYRVHLVDLVPAHVAQAASLPGVTAAVGDARDLHAPDASVDAVLLLGPLYHLTESGDRVRALCEARRLTRPGGLVAAAVISRYAGLLDLVRRGALDEEMLPLVVRTIQTGVHDSRVGFMETHFHTGPEAVSEFAEAGLPHAVVYGVEGPGWGIATASAGSDNAEAVFDSALRAARTTERDPLMHATSGHLIVAATVSGDVPTADQRW